MPCALCGHAIDDQPVMDHGNAYHTFCWARRRHVMREVSEMTGDERAALRSWFRRDVPDGPHFCPACRRDLASTAFRRSTPGVVSMLPVACRECLDAGWR
jgi:hypothetical protein